VLLLALRFFTGWGKRKEMVMCAAVSVMICYRGERQGNDEVCCC